MKYVLAISGGVDSVTLLDELTRLPKHYLNDSSAEFVVAHVDHGIRVDSADDELFVRGLAEKYRLSYESTRLQLGANASEALARRGRYDWLRHIQQHYNAQAIVTAHHQDDVLETMMINLIRGTGWRGLCSLYDQPATRRPFIEMSKAEIVQLALQNNLTWREDSTNQSQKYLRNLLRMSVLGKIDGTERSKLIDLYHEQSKLRDAIDEELNGLVAKHAVAEKGSNEIQIDRYWLIMAGQSVVGEFLMVTTGHRFEQATLARLGHFICTARPQTEHYEDGYFFRATVRHLIVSPLHI